MLKPTEKTGDENLDHLTRFARRPIGGNRRQQGLNILGVLIGLAVLLVLTAWRMRRIAEAQREIDVVIIHGVSPVHVPRR